MGGLREELPPFRKMTKENISILPLEQSLSPRNAKVTLLPKGKTSANILTAEKSKDPGVPITLHKPLKSTNLRHNLPTVESLIIAIKNYYLGQFESRLLYMQPKVF